jgi:hypothetical protein
MIEVFIFIYLVGILTIAGLLVIQPAHVHIFWLLAPVFILLLPGIYAFTMSPYIPSKKENIGTILKLAGVKSTDVVYDLGSGDGRLIFAAAPYAKKAIGYELSVPLLIWCYIKKIFKWSKASFRFGNFFNKDFSDANVILCYLPQEIIERFQKEIMPTLSPGTRIVISISTAGLLGVKPIEQDGKVYLYIR